MKAIIKNVPVNAGLNHWIGLSVEVIKEQITPKGTLCMVSHGDMICELLIQNLTFETQTGSIPANVGYPTFKGNTVAPVKTVYPLGENTDEHGRTFVQTVNGRIY